MMKKRRITIWTSLLFSLLFLSGCQEEYIATLDNMEPILVVDGLITDQPGPHTLTLSKTAKFQGETQPEKVSGASLWITSSDGSTISLFEIQPGVYRTPSSFSGSIGNSYTLHITTPDGEVYRSAPQEILAPLTLDSIFGQLGQEIFFSHSPISSNVYVSAVQGAHTFLKTSGGSAEITRYRFISELYLQYVIEHGGVGGAAETYSNCWTKRIINDQLANDVGNPNSLPQSTDKVGFVMRYSEDYVYYGITPQLYDLHRVLINKIYTLNEDSYLFHKAKNEQLGDEGRFFDPIASQIPGNLRCTSDPSKRVLGLFEASSVFVITYKVLADYLNNNVSIEMISNLDNIPNSGCLYEQFPDHWLPQ